MAEKDNNDFIWLFNRYRTTTTLKEFMDREYIYGITPKDFFELNRELIFQQSSPANREDFKKINGKYPTSKKDITIDFPLPCPCVLKIQSSKVTSELAISQTNFQADVGDFYAFASEQIRKILQNEGYVIDASQKINPTVQVFGWFKTLYLLGRDEKTKEVLTIDKNASEFADLSKHIQNLSTLSSKDGASFSFRLPIISFESVGGGFIWGKNNPEFLLDKQLVTTDNTTYNFNGEFYSKNSYDKVEENYYNWLISSNDLIFISFEKLKMETKRSDSIFNRDSNNFDIKTDISQNVYDLIGLVDEVKVVSDSASSNAYVEVTGRDLMKLLIEDGSFFFNPSTAVEPSLVFSNDQSYNKQGDIRDVDQLDGKYQAINRMRRIAGEIDIFSNRQNMNIDFILKGVISQLANIEVVPSFVFDSWGFARTTFIELQPKEGEKNATN